jgi:hypothetical protein
MKTKIPIKALQALILLVTTISAAAQSAGDYNLRRNSFSAGGTGAGGDFTLTSTIGQPAAGALSAGDFTLVAGFLTILSEIQPPVLTIERDPANGALTVSWPLVAADYVLEQTPALNGTGTPWLPVTSLYQTNATHIFITVAAPSGQNFYRLRQP